MSFVPTNAWVSGPTDFIPTREFRYNQCDEAKKYARAHKLIMLAVETSDEARTMGYIVGPWCSTVEDMILRRQLWTARGTSDLMATNRKAFLSVYECVNGADQQTIPYFDLEYYSDFTVGNTEHPDILPRTEVVGRIAAMLMSQLFPDQIRLADSPCITEGFESIGSLIRTHYTSPAVGTLPPKATIDVERHWIVLDASLDAKKSQHLILDPDTNVCWDTLVDQAIFVGLLMRCIYAAAFSQDPVDGKTLVELCRSLFITELHTDTRGGAKAPKPAPKKKVWTTIVDSVVYKRFQLVRTVYSSKRTQERPLLPQPRHGQPQASSDSDMETRAWYLRHTMVTRVPRDPERTQRLSFAQCYPQMFPPQESPTPSSALDLHAWKWVPNYHGNRNEAPPLLPFSSGGSKPWHVVVGDEHQRCHTAIRQWLALSDPCRKDQPLSLAPIPRPVGGGGGGTTTSMFYDAATGQQRRAAMCLAAFIMRIPALRPWVAGRSLQQVAASIAKIKPSSYMNPKTGVVTQSALVSLNDKYCPIQQSRHKHGIPFMLINARTGVARIKCLAGKCANRDYVLPEVLLSEDLDLIFPRPLPPPPPRKKQKTNSHSK